MDLEASTLAHAYVYFEKLVIKVRKWGGGSTGSIHDELLLYIECCHEEEQEVDCSLLLVFGLQGE